MKLFKQQQQQITIKKYSLRVKSIRYNYKVVIFLNNLFKPYSMSMQLIPTYHINTKFPKPEQYSDIGSYISKNKSTIELKEKRIKILNYVHIPDRSVPPLAVAVLPTALQIRQNTIFPKTTLPMQVRFGPLRGISNKILHVEANELVFKAAVSKTPIFLMGKDNDSVIHIDVSDKDKSNWLGLLPLGDEKTANVWLYEEDNQIYAVTTQCIAARTPLALGYSKQYAEEHGLPGGQPTVDFNEVSSARPRQWWCHECRLAMSSAVMLQRHLDVHHKEDKIRSHRRYRCGQCSRTFCRLFTLKRHMARYCCKKPVKPETSPTLDGTLDTTMNTTQSVDDNRLPSDESLQNYTNNLDFSTSLFDTDRISNLDISGCSRSEVEFNYSMGIKNENTLTNDLGFIKSSNGSDNKLNKRVEAEVQKLQTFLKSCPHCKQTVMKGKQRQHVRVCAARRFECECGLVFSTKQRLAQHIHTKHSDSFIAKTAAKDSSQPYKCEVCQHPFVRRGMLVNHLWRVHGSAAGAVPLERRVRHYPCAACPKIYRAAAKRDRHVRNHHPGAEQILTRPIEGGRLVCAPAACAACPRQYATRAKLLQHMRAHHPHLAPPLRKKVAVKATSNQNQAIALPDFPESFNFF